MSKTKSSVESEKIKNDVKTDDASNTYPSKVESEGADNRKGFYKSQAEVDAAISKRLKAQREKIMREVQDDLDLAKMVRESLDEMPDRQILPDSDKEELQKISQQYLDFEDEIRKSDKDFDLLDMLENNELAQALISSGVDLKKIYEFMNLDKLVSKAKNDGERDALDRIRQRRSLPDAAPAGSSNHPVGSSLTTSQMNDINERLKKGEKVYLK